MPTAAPTPPSTPTHTVTVNISDVDEVLNPPAQVLVGAVGTVSGHQPHGELVSGCDCPASRRRPTTTCATTQAAPNPENEADWVEAGETGGHDHVGTATQATITGLTASTTYQVQVRATNHEGTGAWSASAAGATTSGTVITSLVSTLNQSVANPFAFGAEWNDGATPAARRIAQSFTTGSSRSGYTLTSVNLDLILAGAGSLADPAYSVTIRSADASGNNPGTSLGTLTKPASLVSNTNVFTAPGDGITLAANTTYFVLIEPTTVDSRRTVIGQTTINGTEDRGGAAGWSIGDKFQKPPPTGQANWPAQNAAMLMSVRGYAPPSVPDQPTGLTPGTATATSLAVSWTAPTDAGDSAISDYDVRYYAGSSDPANEADWIVAGETGGHDHVGIATTATITGLSASTVYRVQVRAISATGAGEWSSALPVATSSGPAVTTLVSNMGQTPSSDPFNNGWAATNGVRMAQQFTVGSDTEGYMLTAVHIDLLVADAHNADPDYSVTIREIAGTGFNERPGKVVGSLLEPSALVPGRNVFFAAGNGVPLDPGTRYFISVDVTAASGRKTVETNTTQSMSEDGGAAAGWNLANGKLYTIQRALSGLTGPVHDGRPGPFRGAADGLARCAHRGDGERCRGGQPHRELDRPRLRWAIRRSPATTCATTSAAARPRRPRCGLPPARQAATTMWAPPRRPPSPGCGPTPPTRCRCGPGTRWARARGRPRPAAPPARGRARPW